MANVYTISARKSFLDVLAKSLLKETEKSPDKLQEYLILLPTRRACTSLRDAFLNHSKEKALILPSIQPIGDISEPQDFFWFNQDFEIEKQLPPAISSMKRLMVLSKLVMQKATAQGINMSPHTSFILGRELASLLDEIVIENLSWEKLNEIIPENLNTYWQDVLTFLQIISTVYPAYLKENGLSDIKESEVFKIKNISEIWQKSPPKQKIIAAGNTASIPIISDLLKVIANLENGCVILPALDTQSSDDDFNTFEEGHYQYSLKRFLNNVGMSRSGVKEWGKDVEVFETNNDRLRLVTESLKPTELTQNWRFINELSPDCLDNVYKIETSDDREEALSIALIMREVLQTQGKTAALVTTDVNLGKRVSLELERFGININNSAGLSLGATPVGIFFNLLIEFCISPSPIPLLALLKHPFASAGFGDECKNIARNFENQLRGKIKVHSIDELSEILGQEFDNIVTILNPLLEMGENKYDLEYILTNHIKCAQSFVKDENILWQGSAGKAISNLLTQLLQDGKDFMDVSLQDYAKLFLQFQNQILVRNPYNTHKRLEILGPMEARLQHKDVMILGSLNDGMFPKNEDAGPWMSYQMRIDFGLPSLKQRLGISASDFCNCFMAPTVYLTRSLKSGGTPTIASRWLQRLEAVINIAGKSAKEKSKWSETDWKKYAFLIDEPKERIKISPVSANPDISVRPKKISVSAMESLMKDPYSFYAKYILRLKPLPDLEPKITPKKYGTAVHEIFAWFIENYQNLPDNSFELITEQAKKTFKEQGIPLFWLMLFNRASKWLIEELSNRDGAKSFPEVKGSTKIRNIELTAIADRIDVDRESNSVIIDYKTGTPPTPSAVAAGYSPQLVIEALIAIAGGFKDIPPTTPEKISYYHISGKGDGAVEKKATSDKMDLKDLISRTEKGIEKVLKVFYEEGIAYEARPDPLIEFRYSDYEHLERVKEWGFVEGAEE